MFRQKKIIRGGIIAIILLAVIAIPIFLRQSARRRDEFMTSSCANHAIQLRMMVAEYLEQPDPFPSESDARGAFLKMATLIR